MSQRVQKTDKEFAVRDKAEGKGSPNPWEAVGMLLRSWFFIPYTMGSMEGFYVIYLVFGKIIWEQALEEIGKQAEANYDT